MKRWLWFLLLPALTARPATPRDLQVGIAGHAFDHLGSIGEQAEAAAASGSTLIYATGFGGDGYQGLPAPTELEARRKAVAAYHYSDTFRDFHFLSSFIRRFRWDM
jgi:hypothetical protein